MTGKRIRLAGSLGCLLLVGSCNGTNLGDFESPLTWIAWSPVVTAVLALVCVMLLACCLEELRWIRKLLSGQPVNIDGEIVRPAIRPPNAEAPASTADA